jgi:hypothetical protein
MQGFARLVKKNEKEYAYRRLYSNAVNVIPAEKIERIFRSVFPAKKYSEGDALQALDIATVSERITFSAS